MSCTDCLSCPASAVRMGQATWAIWAAVKKYSLCNYFILSVCDFAGDSIANNYGYPVPAAIKLIRVICAAGRHMAASVVSTQ